MSDGSSDISNYLQINRSSAFSLIQYLVMARYRSKISPEPILTDIPWHFYEWGKHLHYFYGLADTSRSVGFTAVTETHVSERV